MVKIGWSLVLFFSITLLAGSFFAGYGTDTGKSADSAYAFASLGQYPLDPGRFQRVLDSFLVQSNNDPATLSPVLLEQALLFSLNVVRENAGYTIAAQERDITVTKQAISQLEKEVILQENLKNKSELKDLLKKNKVSYASFKENLKQEALVRAYKQELMQGVRVSDAVVDASLMSYKLAYFVVKNTDLSPEQLQLAAQQAFELLQQSTKIAEIKKDMAAIVSASYLESPQLEPYLALTPQVRDAVSGDVPLNEWQLPVCMDAYCVIVAIQDRVIQNRPEGEAEKEYVQSLQQQLQQEAASMELARVFAKHALTIEVPQLRAVYYKSIGDYTQALAAYQHIGSADPSSPVPHFFIADIKYRLGQTDQAILELEKAALKLKLNTAIAFPEFYIFYGDLLIGNKDRVKAKAEYQKAFELSKNKKQYLTILQKRYRDHRFKSELKQVTAQLAVLTEEEQETDDSNAVLTPQ